MIHGFPKPKLAFHRITERSLSQGQVFGIPPKFSWSNCTQMLARLNNKTCKVRPKNTAILERLVGQSGNDIRTSCGCLSRRVFRLFITGPTSDTDKKKQLQIYAGLRVQNIQKKIVQQNKWA